MDKAITRKMVEVVQVRDGRGRSGDWWGRLQRQSEATTGCSLYAGDGQGEKFEMSVVSSLRDEANQDVIRQD